MLRSFLAVSVVALFAICGCSHTPAPATRPAMQPVAADTGDRWQSLFNGKDLGNWRVSDFAGHGEVAVKDGLLILPMGDGLTAVTWKGEPPYRNNYEISVEAMKLQGSDFFCGLTFPVKNSAASFICGGWGGGVCGISSIDDRDASDNSTTSTYSFEDKKWYRIRVQVTDNRIQAWIDGDQKVDADIKGKKVDLRIDIDDCKPMGLATWQTKGAFRNVEMRRLRKDEIPTE